MKKKSAKLKQPKLPQASHADLIKAIRDILDYCKYEHYKNWGGPMGQKGLPDITALEPNTGRYIGIEAKVGRDKLSDDQIKIKGKILRSNAIFIEARTVDDLINGLGLQERFLRF